MGRFSGAISGGFVIWEGFLLISAVAARLGRLPNQFLPVLEVTEIHRRVIAAQGPVLLFERPIKVDGAVSDVPLVVNLFGTIERVSLNWLAIASSDLAQLGEFLALLRQPVPPLRPARSIAPVAGIAVALDGRPEIIRGAAAQKHVRLGSDVDLGFLPIQTCWPDEPAPLITWPIVITRPPHDEDPRAYNLSNT